MSQAEADLLLIRRCQRGDRAAFDSLVSQYEQRAYQYAYRLTRDQDEACDVVADAFLRVYSALKNFKGKSTFSTWLYRIVSNVYFDRRKRERRHSHLSLDSPSGADETRTLDLPDASDGPEQLVEQGARQDVLQQALDSLPELHRAMLVMFHLEGLSYIEIAEALDLPVGTVKSRLNRARLALRDEVGASMELFEV
ncbi:MAG: sigma-70 family RNA polymerase sigma factor [Fimbriimonadaceae bacterium]|nr:sigma-70 family RNA polymerase sigma factor [Fimbriimonadaceae bacterium]